ncbi:MAG: hypothetical protein AAB553_05190 [Patescibacteria group bacterium]
MLDEKQKKIPTVVEALEKLMTRGTVLEYREKDIIFNNHLSPIKSLKVTVSSIETKDQSVLHKLQKNIRQISD